MSTATASTAVRLGGAFRHEALLYAGTADFVHRTADFVRAGVAGEEPVLVVVSAAKIDLLREELGADAAAVHFADMAQVGRNPARIIGAWQDFVAERAAPDRPLRGVGEPIWSDRPAAELAECQRHEALLNLAFAGSPTWWLLCPYDVTALDGAVLDEARRSHPFVLDGAGHHRSDRYSDALARDPFSGALPEPGGPAEEMPFGGGELDAVRRLVLAHAAAHGLGLRQTEDLALAAHEVATNSVRHGGGRGTVRLWAEDRVLVCEIRDAGRIAEPLVGRERPAVDRENGRGLWIANRLCDLVQIRSSPTGTVVRLHLARD